MSAASINAIVLNFEQLPSRALIAAVMAVKEVALTEAVRIAGGDRRLHNAGRTKLGASDDYRTGATTATVRATPPGPWSWFDKGTQPHLIGFGRASRKTANYTKAMRGRTNLRPRLRMPSSTNGVVTGPVYHPGMKARNSWRIVMRRSQPIVEHIWQVETAKALNSG